MKCRILFSGKNKKNIINLSAENAQRVVKVKLESIYIFLISPQKHRLWVLIRSASYPQHMFLWRNKKKLSGYFSFLKLCCAFPDQTGVTMNSFHRSCHGLVHLV